MNKDLFFNNEFGLPSIIRGNVRIDWVDMNEGLDGDYDNENPDDRKLLRFDVYRKQGDQWEAIEDGSYCTMVGESTINNVLIEYLTHFMDTIYDDVSSHGKAKRLCESLSWTSNE